MIIDLHRTIAITGILCTVAMPAGARELATYTALVDARAASASWRTNAHR